MTEPEVIDPVSTGVAEYNPIAAGLAALRSTYGSLTFDLTTTAGDKAARAARLELVTLRTTLEKRRKELKAPVLERAKLIDDEAKRITGEILALENPIDDQIKADEKRRAEEKAAREKAERERITGLEYRLSLITGLPVKYATSTGEQLNEAVTHLQQLPIGDDWQEYKERAEAARQQVLESLRMLHQAAVIREEQELARRAEEERLAAERRALEEQRAAQEAEQRKWREAAAAAEREARERREAEEARLAAERAEIERQRAELTKAVPTIQPEQIVRGDSDGSPPPVAPQLVGFPLATIAEHAVDFTPPPQVMPQPVVYAAGDPIPFVSPIFGVAVRAPTVDENADILRLVEAVPQAVFDVLRLKVLSRGWELKVDPMDDGK
jgi:hypothetical protein